MNFKISPTIIVQNCECIVLDCETTGLEKNDDVVSAAAIRITPCNIHIETALDQRYSLEEVGISSEIHGEMSSNLNDRKTDDNLQELIDFVGNSILVGHNITFDIAKIEGLLRVNYDFKGGLKNKVLDTARLVKRLDPVKFERMVGGNSNLDLEELCRQFDITVENRHTALGDAYLTAQLFQKILSRLRKRGVKFVKDLF